MPFANRTDLRVSILAFLMRPGDTEMTDGVLNDIIALMEADAFRRLDLNDIETHDDAFALTGEFTPLPDGFKGFRRVPRINGVRLILASPSEIDDETDPSTTDTPRLFCIEGNELRVGPPPTDGTTLDMTYFGRPVAIDDSTANFLLTDHPDLYLYGSLKHAAPYIGEDGRMSLWASNYETAIAQIKAADKRKKWSGQSEQRIAGATP